MLILFAGSSERLDTENKDVAAHTHLAFKSIILNKPDVERRAPIFAPLKEKPDCSTRSCFQIVSLDSSIYGIFSHRSISCPLSSYKEVDVQFIRLSTHTLLLKDSSHLTERQDDRQKGKRPIGSFPQTAIKVGTVQLKSGGRSCLSS